MGKEKNATFDAQVLDFTSENEAAIYFKDRLSKAHANEHFVTYIRITGKVSRFIIDFSISLLSKTITIQPEGCVKTVCPLTAPDFEEKIAYSVNCGLNAHY